VTTTRSDQFDLRGFHHVALVSRDMQDTVDFYEGILGFPLVKTLQLGPDGQHFFFQVTEDEGVAFFWFRNVSPAQPGVASADWYAGETTPKSARGLVSKAAPGAMHHLSFGVPEDKLEEYRHRLIEAGVEVTDIVTHHDENGEVIRSIYFRDPDGIMLEFSAWAQPLAAGTSDFVPAAAGDAAVRRRDGIPYTL
jgi:catechol 2,3-dioxygenase-like lactoylglutathione lyase family enzyme